VVVAVEGVAAAATAVVVAADRADNNGNRIFLNNGSWMTLRRS
jgi:hypothetical protein